LSHETAIHLVNSLGQEGAVSRSLNKAILIGNLGADPEIRSTANGTRVANFRIATSRRFTDRAGQEQENTQWHTIVAWDKLADVVERFLKKGERVYVEGEIEYRQYEAKDGTGTRYVTEIRARDLLLLGGRGEGGGDVASGSRGRAPARAASGGGDYDDFQAPPLEEEDDLPF
jgi:single-strand DNA-binding protein